MVKVNFLTVHLKNRTTKEKSLLTLENLGKINMSSQMKSFHQTNGENAPANATDFPIEPKIISHSIFTGKIWKSQSKLVKLKTHIFLAFLLKNSTSYRKELKFFLLNQEQAEIRPIPWSCMFVLSNSNRGSSRTQYHFEVVKACDFPQSKS